MERHTRKCPTTPCGYVHSRRITSNPRGCYCYSDNSSSAAVPWPSETSDNDIVIAETAKVVNVRALLWLYQAIVLLI